MDQKYIKKLDAGEELDKLVALEVMGMIPCNKWEYGNLGSFGGPFFRKNCEHVNCYPSQHIDTINGRVGGCPQYSSRFLYALEVWQKLRETNKFCCLNIESDYSYIYVIKLTKEDFSKNAKHEPCIIVEDENLCVVICKAALLGMNIINQNKKERGYNEKNNRSENRDNSN